MDVTAVEYEFYVFAKTHSNRPTCRDPYEDYTVRVYAVSRIIYYGQRIRVPCRGLKVESVCDEKIGKFIIGV